MGSFREKNKYSNISNKNLALKILCIHYIQAKLFRNFSSEKCIEVKLFISVWLFATFSHCFTPFYLSASPLHVFLYFSPSHNSFFSSRPVQFLHSSTLKQNFVDKSFSLKTAFFGWSAHFLVKILSFYLVYNK